MLLDFDILNTPDMHMAYAECHHLAWCLGRICAVRPGTIGLSRGDKAEGLNYLTWRDVTITRGPDHRFIARVVFRSLKTNNVPAEKFNQKSTQHMTVECQILSPKKPEIVGMNRYG